MKRSICSAALAAGLLLLGLAATDKAVEPVSLDNVVDPGPNSPDEPLAAEFSLDRAVQFLDAAALTWQKEQKCFTCHTNFAYLYARPTVSSDATAHRVVRDFAEQLVSQRWPAEGPRWDAEVVATAAALAFNDAATTGKLHPLTRTALDRMWTVQQKGGGWNWLKCNWPPMESDDHYGVTLAAIAVGAAPEKYSETPAAQQGLVGIRRYLQDNPPPTLHHQAMLLWAASYLPDLQTDKEKTATVTRLLSLQKPDGGWGLATFGNWQRGDKLPQDLEKSDGYGTGFALFVLRRSGMSPSEEAPRRGVQWLKTHQRKSGRWFTRSLNEDSMHYITHAGTAMAIMALSTCDDSQSAAPSSPSPPAATR
jgi:squalene-hopene/tetraprenyl-beta-curcumene cyclase